MNGQRLFAARLSALLRDRGAMGLILLALAAALFSGWLSGEREAARFGVAVINRDEGPLGGRLVEMLGEEADITLLHLEENEARRRLAQGRLQCLFVVSADFSERLGRREYSGLLELEAAPGCSYSSAISEPLINSAMKLWLERQSIYDLDAFLEEQGLSLGEAQRGELLRDMESIWLSGAAVSTRRVVMGGESAGDPSNALDAAATVSLGWYAALSFMFLVAGGGWMSQLSNRRLLEKTEQTGTGLAKLFLWQAAASLLPLLPGFAAVAALMGPVALLPGLLASFLLYCMGALGMALVVCSLCRELSTLLLAAPVAALGTAAVSGLLGPLPEWGKVWELISRWLPGGPLLLALEGHPEYGAAIAAALGWLAVGLLASKLFSLTESKASH